MEVPLLFLVPTCPLFLVLLVFPSVSPLGFPIVPFHIYSCPVHLNPHLDLLIVWDSGVILLYLVLPYLDRLGFSAV